MRGGSARGSGIGIGIGRIGRIGSRGSLGIPRLPRLRLEHTRNARESTEYPLESRSLTEASIQHLICILPGKVGATLGYIL